jgi:hypothetical protein
MVLEFTVFSSTEERTVNFETVMKKSGDGPIKAVETMVRTDDKGKI